jgi:hypothetical protein
VTPTITTLGHPEGGAAVSPSYVEFDAPSDEDRRQSLSQHPRTRLQPHKPDGVRKPRTRNSLTHRDVNQAGIRDTAITAELWESDEGDGTPAETAELGSSEQDTKQYAAKLLDPEQAHREAIERRNGQNQPFDTPCNSEATDHQKREEAQGAPTGQEVKFHVYEQGGWRNTDMVSVHPNHIAEAQTIANQYARDPNQNARFYDCQLRKLAVDECVRAAIDDGSYTVLMSFQRDLAVTRQLVASVALLLKTDGNDKQGYGPELSQGHVENN